MAISDGELMSLWLQRTSAWMAALEAVRQAHIARHGRTVGPVRWTASPAFGPWTWLGFFWEQERFWFGYGFDGRDWRAMIEADTRRPEAAAWELLARQVPQIWQFQKIEHYLRLWGPSSLQAPTDPQQAWLNARAQELHEYALAEG